MPRQLEALGGMMAPDGLSGAGAARNGQLLHAGAQSLMAYRNRDHRRGRSGDADRRRMPPWQRAIDQLSGSSGAWRRGGPMDGDPLARGWEAAKTGLVSALTTGLASAVLLAIGARDRGHGPPRRVEIARVASIGWLRSQRTTPRGEPRHRSPGAAPCAMLAPPRRSHRGAASDGHRGGRITWH